MPRLEIPSRSRCTTFIDTPCAVFLIRDKHTPTFGPLLQHTCYMAWTKFVSNVHDIKVTDSRHWVHALLPSHRWAPRLRTGIVSLGGHGHMNHRPARPENDVKQTLLLAYCKRYCSATENIDKPRDISRHDLRHARQDTHVHFATFQAFTT